VGNANIKGNVRTGPGANTISIGSNGSVGDRPWVEGGTLGIETGHSSTDFNVIFPDVVLPVATFKNANAAGAGTTAPDGLKYKYIFLQADSGDWAINNFNGNDNLIYVGTNANVRIWITTDIITSSRN